MIISELVTFTVAMLAITNPIGNLAIFASLTAGKSEDNKKKAAFIAGLAIAIILIIVIWTGDHILDAFGISTPAFETAGGLIIALMGLSMLHAKTSEIHHTKGEHEEAKTKESVAVVPIAIPLVAGPGAITTIIVHSHQFGTAADRLYVSLICIGLALILWICFYFSAPVSRLLGVSGINIVTRIMGIILTAIAFQMIAEGLKGLFPALG